MPEETKTAVLTFHSRGQAAIHTVIACGFIASLAATLFQGISLLGLFWCLVLWLILGTIWYLVTTRQPDVPAHPECIKTADSAKEQRVSQESEFLSAMGHDLRQPTQAIALFAATLSAQPLPDASRKLVRGIEEAIHQLSEQMEAVFAIAKVQAGRMNCNLQRIPLGDLFETQLSVHLDDAHEKNLHLRHVRTARYTMADEEILSRIIARMIEHAIQSTREGGIVLGCRSMQDRCRIEVWASSEGIAEAKLAQAFTPGSSYGQAFPDRGLGLVLAYRLSALLHGKLEISSPKGHGLKLSLELPRA